MSKSQSEASVAGKFLLAWVVVVVATALFGLFRFNLLPDTSYPWMSADFLNADKSISRVLGQWDGVWYIGLAEQGYSYQPGQMSNVAFLPLYPLLLSGLSMITQSIRVSGLLLNLAALFVALVYLQKIMVQEKMKEADQRYALALLLLYPTAIFYMAVYTEALFLMLAVLFFFSARQRQWWVAGLCGLLATLTRIPGVFLFVPLVYFMWKQKVLWPTYLWSGLVPLGTLIYLVIQKITVGDPLAFLQTQKSWGRQFFQLNSEHFQFLTYPSIVNGVMDLVMAAALLFGVYLVYKKLNFGYASFCFLALAVPLSTGTTMSVMRFGMILFPIFLAVAKVKNDSLRLGILIISVVLFTFYTTQFVNGYWSG